MKQYGFKPDIIQPEDYVLGGYSKLTPEVLQGNGQWDSSLPVKELQQRGGVETMACTVFTSLNALETLYKRKYEVDMNFSDKYTAIMAGITQQGGTPKNAIETIRKKSGLLLEEHMPFGNPQSWEDFYTPYPSGSTIAQGLNFLQHYTINYEWVFKNGVNIDKMKTALKSSPLGVSVCAWKERDGIYYKDIGDTDNHWCLIYGYESGKYWKVFDTYDNTRKKLAWNYNFGLCMRYSITRREPRKRYWFIELLGNIF